MITLVEKNVKALQLFQKTNFKMIALIVQQMYQMVMFRTSANLSCMKMRFLYISDDYRTTET